VEASEDNTPQVNETAAIQRVSDANSIVGIELHSVVHNSLLSEEKHGTAV